jgi:hypothetical protein
LIASHPSPDAAYRRLKLHVAVVAKLACELLRLLGHGCVNGKQDIPRQGIVILNVIHVYERNQDDQAALLRQEGSGVARHSFTRRTDQRKTVFA